MAKNTKGGNNPRESKQTKRNRTIAKIIVAVLVLTLVITYSISFIGYMFE